jgi:uncharacterized protein YbbC (DUF1343 family)
MTKIITGLEELFLHRKDLVADKRVGLLTHAAAVDSKLNLAADLFARDTDCTLASLLAPEHGLYGVAQDMEAVRNQIDPRTEIPVYSLYGSGAETLSPGKDALGGIDVLAVDLQDIGARYYTFIYSMALCLKAAAEAGLPVIVMDRPNPLGGQGVEGNIGSGDFSSFVGLYPLPVRHGMTIGELAQYLNGEIRFGCELTVVAMDGWTRDMHFPDTGLPWVMPSPNMPAYGTALVYPGMCLLEGTNMSEGRGTTRPFEIFGAPFVDPDDLKQALDAEELPGVAFRPVYFKPTFQKWSGEVCGGLQLHVTDPQAFKPFLTGLAVLGNLSRLLPESFCWRYGEYEFVDDRRAIDLLLKDSQIRRLLEEGAALSFIEDYCKKELSDFMPVRQKYLLYD